MQAGKVKIINPSDEYFTVVANMVERVSNMLQRKLNNTHELVPDMVALTAALKGFEDFKNAKNPLLDRAGIAAKLDEYKGGLTTTTKQTMVEHLDNLSAKKCNNFFANLDKHRAMLLESKEDASNKFREVMGSDAAGELIKKLAAAPNLSADGVRAAISEVYQVLAKQLHDPANHIKQVIIEAVAAEIVEGSKPSISTDYPGQKALNSAFEHAHLTVAQAIQKSGMSPNDYPKNDMAVLYALAQNIAEVVRDYTSSLGNSDKSESAGYKHKMDEFERVQRNVAEQIAKYDGTNCAAILANAQKIVHESLVNKFDKKRPLLGDGGGKDDGLKANNTIGDDRATKAVRALDTKLSSASSGYQNLLRQSDGQKYAQARQAIAAPKPVASASVGTAVTTAQRTPPTDAEKAKAQNNSASASAAAATGRPKTPPGTQRNRDASPPKFQH